MTREEILALTDSDLIDYYDTSIGAIQAYNEEWENVCKLNQAWLKERFSQHPLFIIGFVLLVGGMLGAAVLSFLLDTENSMLWLMIGSGVSVFGALMAYIGMRLKKSSTESYRAYKIAKVAFEKLSKSPPEPLASAVIFFGPDDVEKIEELRDIVNNGLANSHPDALREYQRRHEIKDWNELYKKTHEKDLLDKAEQISNIISPFKSSRVSNGSG